MARYSRLAIALAYLLLGFNIAVVFQSQHHQHAAYAQQQIFTVPVVSTSTVQGAAATTTTTTFYIATVTSNVTSFVGQTLTETNVFQTATATQTQSAPAVTQSGGITTQTETTTFITTVTPGQIRMCCVVFSWWSGAKRLLMCVSRHTSIGRHT